MNQFGPPALIFSAAWAFVTQDGKRRPWQQDIDTPTLVVFVVLLLLWWWRWWWWWCGYFPRHPNRFSGCYQYIFSYCFFVCCVENFHSCRVNVKCFSRVKHCRRGPAWLAMFRHQRQPLRSPVSSHQVASQRSRKVCWPTKRITQRQEPSRHRRRRPWPAATTAATAACPARPVPEARLVDCFSCCLSVCHYMAF